MNSTWETLTENYRKILIFRHTETNESLTYVKEQIENKYLIKLHKTRRKYVLWTAKKAGGNFMCHFLCATFCMCHFFFPKVGQTQNSSQKQKASQKLYVVQFAFPKNIVI